MPSTDLPAAVQSALSTALNGVAREPLIASAAVMSRVYRDLGHTDQAVPSRAAALGYSVARMPATYAAAIRVFEEVQRRAPLFQPRSALDLGAGPGTATLAARTIWPSLDTLSLVEPNAHMRALAETFLTSSGSAHTRQIIAAAAKTSAAPQADLVILSYVLAEQPESHIAALAHFAAQRTLQTLVIIEPGRTAGFERIKIARTALATADGMAILAPCPHTNACPLAAPDWCHFSVRLARSREHKQLKGADAPFEDEPYSYLALTRDRVHPASPSRVLRRPRVTKADVTLQLCTTTGLKESRLSRRDKAGYKAAKAIDWGDVFVAATTTPPETAS